MKNIYYLLIFLLSSFSAIHAQTIQKGNVVLQNSGSKSLGGVQITAFGAQPTDTDNNGEFKLHFSKTSVGELAPIRQAYKKGYELVNKHETEQWILSDSKALRVVMCPSGSLQAAREKYYGIGSSLYIKRYEQTYAAIEKQKEVNALNDTAYANRLEEAYNELTQSQERLAEYADQFARVNLDDLSELEHQAHALLEDGKLDEAIQIYENQKLLEKLKQQATIKEQAGENMEAMIPSLKRYADMCIFGGGKENMDKAKEILKAVAESDLANSVNQAAYAQFMHMQTDYLGVIDWMKEVLPKAATRLELAGYQKILGEGYYRQGDYSNATNHLNVSKDIYTSISNDNPSIDLQVENIICILGYIHMFLKQYDEALSMAMQAQTMHESIKEIPDSTSFLLLSSSVSGLKGTIYLQQSIDYQSNNRIDTLSALYELQRAVHFAKLTVKADSTRMIGQLRTTQSNLASFYMKIGDYANAKDLLLEVLKINEKIYNNSPKQGQLELATTYNLLGLLYEKMSENDLSEKSFLKSIELRTGMLDINPNLTRPQLAVSYKNLAGLFLNRNELKQSSDYLLKSINLLNLLVETNPKQYAFDLASELYTLAVIYDLSEDYDKARVYYETFLNFLALHKDVKLDNLYQNVLFKLDQAYVLTDMDASPEIQGLICSLFYDSKNSESEATHRFISLENMYLGEDAPFKSYNSQTRIHKIYRRIISIYESILDEAERNPDIEFAAPFVVHFMSEIGLYFCKENKREEARAAYSLLLRVMDSTTKLSEEDKSIIAAYSDYTVERNIFNERFATSKVLSTHILNNINQLHDYIKLNN